MSTTISETEHEGGQSEDDVSTVDANRADAVSTVSRPESKKPRTVAVSLPTVVIAILITALLAAACVFGVLYFSAEHELSGRDTRAADDKHAEQVAMDYSVGASTIDFHDTKTWLTKLKANTAPNLAAKFDATAPQLDQILLPLQWTSKASPIGAMVTSESGGVYKVNAFLTVNSTSAQTPQGGQTTVTYALTVDKNSGWKITDVGGLDGALPVK